MMPVQTPAPPAAEVCQTCRLPFRQVDAIWVTGYDGWSFYVHQCVVVPPEGEPIFFGRAMDAVGVRFTAYLAAAGIIGYSAETPLSATALAELAHRASFPPGVFNVVTGDAPEIVGAWCGDARVRALSFTGSTEIGKLLYRQSSDTVKRLVLELGGHAPFIAFAD